MASLLLQSCCCVGYDTWSAVAAACCQGEAVHSALKSAAVGRMKLTNCFERWLSTSRVSAAWLSLQSSEVSNNLAVRVTTVKVHGVLNRNCHFHM